MLGLLLSESGPVLFFAIDGWVSVREADAHDLMCAETASEVMLLQEARACAVLRPCLSRLCVLTAVGRDDEGNVSTKSPVSCDGTHAHRC
jgi:hypothetical protein